MINRCCQDLERSTCVNLALQYPVALAEQTLIFPPLLLLVTFSLSVTGLALRRQLGFVLLHAFRHASCAWLNALAEAFHVFHAGMMPFRFRDFRATAAG